MTGKPGASGGARKGAGRPKKLPPSSTISNKSNTDNQIDSNAAELIQINSNLLTLIATIQIEIKRLTERLTKAAAMHCQAKKSLALVHPPKEQDRRTLDAAVNRTIMILEDKYEGPPL